MLHISEYVTEVKQAIDDVVEISGHKNCKALARRLDVTRQALSKWRQSGLVPANRALQMELITEGEVTWRQLCPDIVAEYKAEIGGVYSVRK